MASLRNLAIKKYRLSSGVEVDLQNATGSNGSIAYINHDGSVSTVYVNVSEPISGDATRSLCRTWNMNTFEIWGYINDKYVAHGKQVLKSGKVESSFSAIDGGKVDINGNTIVISEEDYVDDGSEFCYKMVITSFGTYICFFMNGESEVRSWKWKDKSLGTVYYNDYDEDEDYDRYFDYYFTIRFSGKQMRLYEDYTYPESSFTGRIVYVATLIAAN